MNDRERERLRRLLFPEPGDDWEAVRDEQRRAPREPGRYKLDVAGEPRRVEFDSDCPDCGQRLRSSGVAFGSFDCPVHPTLEDCLPLHVHWTLNCPAWRKRLPRITRRVKDRVVGRLASRRWRRRARRERSDPNAWKDYWADGGTAP